MDPRPPLGVAGRPLRAGGHQRHDLAGEGLHGRARLGLHGDPQHRLGGLALGPADALHRHARPRSQALHERVAEAVPRRGETLEDDPSAACRLLGGAVAHDHERARRPEAVVVGGADLERGGARHAARAAHAHPVGAGRLHGQIEERHAHVGAHVAGRIADLVDELLLHGGRGHGAAGPGRLRDRAAAMAVDLGDGEADVGRAGEVEPVGGDAAGDLRAALQEVAGDGGAGEAVPIVVAPAELVHAGPDHERGIGDAAGDHDIGAGRQRRHDPPAAEVGVGGDEPVAHGRQRRAAVEIGEARVVAAGGTQQLEALVAGDDPDRERPAAALLERGPAGGGAGGGGEAAGVGDEPAAAARGPVVGQAAHGLDEVARVAEGGVALALARQDRHRHLGEVVEREVVEIGLLREEVACGRRAVAPEGLGVADAEDVLRHTSHPLPAPRRRSSGRASASAAASQRRV